MKTFDGLTTAIIDMLLALFVVCLAMVAIEQESKSSDKPVCRLAVDIQWPESADVDVDLWVVAPGDKPVGYSSKSGRVFDLIRDDTGNPGSGATDPNEERACARNIPDGEWIVNLHMYGNYHHTPYPIPVEVSVVIIDPFEGRMTEMVSRSADLSSAGQELTVVRFETKDEKFVSGSESELPIKLRSKK
jgi:hypothetical protein